MIYLICGTPGTGKTTYAKKLSKENDAVLYSLDDQMHERYGENHECDLSIREYATKYELLLTVIDHVKAGKNVILDYGFFKNKERKWYRELAARFGVGSELHFVTTEYDVQLGRVLKRNKEEKNVHEIDKEILDYLLTLFEVPEDEDLITVRT